MKAKHVRAALELRHPELENEWVVMHEPFGIDTLAIRCWTGRIGCRRVAYEIKVSMSDFRREIARPAKRQQAVEISHAFVFAMPWALACDVRHEIPDGLGLVGVIERRGPEYYARDIIKPRLHAPRPLTDTEVAYLVRHRVAPPALRHALLERHDRNQEIRRLRERAELAQRALADLARDKIDVGVELRPEWSPYGVRVLEPPRLVRGRVLVLVESTTTTVGREPSRYEQDLGELLGMGYRIHDAEAEAVLTPS